MPNTTTNLKVCLGQSRSAAASNTEAKTENAKAIRARKIITGIILAVFSLFPAFGQAVRVDPLPAATVSTLAASGSFTPILAIPGATIALCNSPATLATCNNYATTYTDQTEASACPSNAQVVLSGTSTCVSTSNPQGNFGFWVAPGTYFYTIKVNGVFYGPYPITTTSGGGSGCGAGNPTCQISDGGTSATTATAATHNLQFLSPYTGAVARPDDDKMNDFVSVMDFGADSTGIADSSPAFQAAINAASHRRTINGGVKVYVPCGAYTLASTIQFLTTGSSMVGETLACSKLTYTGTVGGIQYTSGTVGELGNFQLRLPNAIAGTYGIWIYAQTAWFHDISVNTCTLGTAFKMNNGLITNGTAPNNVAFNQRNVWTNVIDDGCAKGWQLSKDGATPVPDFLYMDGNQFDAITAVVNLGQVGFELDNGPLFYHSTINLNCKAGDSSGTGTATCIKSSGLWSDNITNLLGEFNNSLGTSTANSVWVTSTGSFGNIGGTVAFDLLTPGSIGTPIPMQIDAGGTTALASSIGLGASAQQPTCNAQTRGRTWVVQGAAGVADVLQVCQKDAANAYAWVTH